MKRRMLAFVSLLSIALHLLAKGIRLRISGLSPALLLMSFAKTILVESEMDRENRENKKPTQRFW
jgi:hypothetical protein